MRFSEIKPEWFATPEAFALVEMIRERRAGAVEGAVNSVREAGANEAARHVGAADAYRGLIIALQPTTTKEGT